MVGKIKFPLQNQGARQYIPTELLVYVILTIVSHRMIDVILSHLHTNICIIFTKDRNVLGIGIFAVLSLKTSHRMNRLDNASPRTILY